LKKWLPSYEGKMVENDKNKHIAIVIQDMYRQGGQYVTSLIAKGLIQRGYRVDLLVSQVHKRIERAQPELRPFPLPDRVRMIQLPCRQASRNVLPLVRYFRREQPGIIIPMAGHYLIATSLARALSGTKAKLIYVEHNLHGATPLRGPKNRSVFRRLVAAITQRMFVFFASRADKIVAVSRGVQQLLFSNLSVVAEHIVTIHNPVMDDIFFIKKSAGPDHPWLRSKEKLVLVAAGALHAQKGFSTLLQSVALLKKEHDFRLIIFGEGEEREKLESLVEQLGLSSDVSLPGHTENLPGNLSASDLFILSSLGETFSIVIAEALACGVPVVATDCPVGPREILADGKYGTLVPLGDVEALSRGIFAALREKKVADKESWLPYRLDTVMDQYESVLKEVVTN